jgi:hypothetical protein
MVMALRVPLASDLYRATHAGVPDLAPTRKGSHHRKRLPRKELARLLATALGHAELGQPKHDEMARHYGRALVAELNRLGLT